MENTLKDEVKTYKLTAVFITLITMFYLFPAAVCLWRGRKNTNAIFTMNTFLGWTGIGWVLALIWAVSDDKKTS